MILYIDVSNPKAAVALIGNKIIKFSFISKYLSETLLMQIQKLLKKAKIDFSDLKKIAVVTGPGPFSRMRTAVVTANTLAYALNISVGGVRVDEIPTDLKKIDKIKYAKQVLPFYQKPPNITKPKK